MPRPSDPRVVVSILGLGQIIVWGTSYFLMAVMATTISQGTGWSHSWVVGGLSLALVISGISSPFVGKVIQESGGRRPLIFSSVALALGLIIIGASPNLGVFLLGWAVLGVGMGAGLYDAAFATLGMLYGQKARRAIASLTLFGGFASSVSWPTTAFLVGEVGWRTTCFIYAAVNVLVVLPLYIGFVPRANSIWPGIVRQRPSHRAAKSKLWLQIFVGFTIAFFLMISSLVAVHLITILEGRGLSQVQAVALSTILGPAQVVARAIEMVTGKMHHPVWTKIAACALQASGILLLSVDAPVAALALAIFGAGIGIESIVRGTLPLAVFGERDYAAIIGKLALPISLGQAVAMYLGAVMLDVLGPTRTLNALCMAALVNLALAVLLLMYLRRRGPLESG
ncbi:MFS transporter [Rhizobium leguminosarum]|uniref:MFS transporter n=1 Tax=Rhizobium leguminosarum TaxID=384 RepID=UPI0024A82074|nr:MFS transporter [Rhizobium leguminosarum]MDI5929665.1 MFS transporter [Rhizobium leguminosarum]